MNDNQIYDLKRLMELHENGTLNKFEFEKQKNRILGIKRKRNPLFLNIIIIIALFMNFLILLSNNSNNSYQTTNFKNTTITDNIETLVAVNPIAINILKACIEANIDTNQIKNLEKESDWINGQRISFSYKGSVLVVYLYENGEVASINKNDIKIYEQGYEALNVEDFILNSSTDVKAKACEHVKTFLKYPRTASFPLFGMRMHKNI